MAMRCSNCGGEDTTYVRARFEILTLGGRFVATEVPSIRCRGCGRTDPAPHARPQFEAVLELAQDEPGATVRKDFTALPLRPDEDPS